MTPPDKTIEAAVGEPVAFTAWTKADGVTGWMQHDGEPVVREGKHGDLGSNRAVHLYRHPAPALTAGGDDVP